MLLHVYLPQHPKSCAPGSWLQAEHSRDPEPGPRSQKFAGWCLCVRPACAVSRPEAVALAIVCGGTLRPVLFAPPLSCSGEQCLIEPVRCVLCLLSQCPAQNFCAATSPRPPRARDLQDPRLPSPHAAAQDSAGKSRGGTCPASGHHFPMASLATKPWMPPNEPHAA